MLFPLSTRLSLRDYQVVSQYPDCYLSTSISTRSRGRYRYLGEVTGERSFLGGCTDRSTGGSWAVLVHALSLHNGSLKYFKSTFMSSHCTLHCRCCH
jgi:hypothetical protein